MTTTTIYKSPHQKKKKKEKKVNNNNHHSSGSNSNHTNGTRSINTNYINNSRGQHNKIVITKRNRSLLNTQHRVLKMQIYYKFQATVQAKQERTRNAFKGKRVINNLYECKFGTPVYFVNSSMQC